MSLSSGQAYGTFPASPQAWLPVQEPGAFLSASVALSTLYPAPTGADPVVGLSLAVSPSGEMEPAFLSFDGTTASWWVWSGVPGRVYTLQLTAETTSGRIYQWLFRQTCDPILAAWPLPYPTTPGFGAPITWTQGSAMFFPSQNLSSVTVTATGTTQLGAAIAPLAKVLVNSGSGLAILLPQSATFGGQTMPVYNRTGGTITIFPFAGDTIESGGVNTGITLQNLQTAHFSVSNSGLLILS